MFYFLFYFKACGTDCHRFNQTCSETGECCPEQCIGGCQVSSEKPFNQICTACKNFIYQNICYKKCPPNTYEVSSPLCLQISNLFCICSVFRSTLHH